MKITNDFFLKNRYIVMMLARDLLVTEPEEQLQTINEYVEKFSVSRGTVQAAMMYLIEQECIETQFRGHLGTYLVTKDQEKLWELSGFGTLSGAMSLPLNDLVAGLATGICDCMKDSSLPFNSIFIQGSKTRLKGLALDKYDFIIASSLTELSLADEFPSITKVLDLPGCAYSGKYVVLFSNPNITSVKDGMTVAVDPSSMDQMYLTKLLCENKADIRYNELTYINTRLSVLKGESDFTVARLDTMDSEHLHLCRNLDIPQFTPKKIATFSSAVVLTNKDHYGIFNILKHTLQPSKISKAQKMVMDHRRSPSYY